MYLSENYTIRAYQTAPDGCARLSTLCNLLQEAASRHAEMLDFGYETMRRRQLFWVLARLTVRVERFPGFGDTVVVRTWPKGFNGPFALRDYQNCELYDRKGIQPEKQRVDPPGTKVCTGYRSCCMCVEQQY